MENKSESNTKSFNLEDQENKVNMVEITVREYTDNGEDYFYQISYVFDKLPLFFEASSCEL